MQSSSTFANVGEQPSMGRDLKNLPGTLPLLLRLVYTSVKKRKAKAADFRTESRRIAALRADRKELKRYRTVCSIEESTNLPLVFPQIMSSRLMYDLLMSPAMPFGIAGLIHLRHEIAAKEDLPADAEYHFECQTHALRETPRGYEIDVLTKAYRAGREVWQSKAVFLYRCRTVRKSEKKSTEQSPEGEYQKIFAESLAANLGLRYAAVSKDYNPIHLSKWSARLFGFERQIAHGLWLVARAADVYGKNKPLHELTIQFRAPIHLPNKINFTQCIDHEASWFRIQAGRGNQVFASGQFK